MKISHFFRNPGFVFLLTLLVASGAHAVDPIGEMEERWYVLQFQGSHAGWMVERGTESEDEIESSTHMHLSIRRGPQTITIDVETSFAETADGKPLSIITKQMMSQQAIITSVTFSENDYTIATTQGGRVDKRTVPLPDGKWLTPAAAGRYVEKKIEEGEKKIRYQSFNPTEGPEPYEMSIELLGEEVVDVYGKKVPAMKTAMENSMQPGVRIIEYSDRDGNSVKATIDLGGIEMQILAADKALAQSKLDPPELMASTLVKPSFELDSPRSMKKAKYRMSLPDTKMPDIGESGVQAVSRVDEQTVLVTIDLENRRDVELESPPTVLNNTVIAGDDPAIVKLRDDAVGDREGAAERAEVMRRFVHRYIQRADLSVGMATASEVAATRTGDCTEHAVLLAAMLQADGIPARTASGLIYVDRFIGKDKIFGYHMWTQAFIDGKWMDLDATLPGAIPYDAAHILLNTSRHEPGSSSNDMVILAPLLGQLRIDLAE